MDIFTIYKATNKINGKSYIGYDSAWPQRKHDHKSQAKLGKGKSRIFLNAIRKHGWDFFEWTIEYQSSDEDFTRSIMEEYFIRYHNTHYIYGNGYNMTYGGEGEKGNRSRTGMPHTKEALFLCSENRKGKGKGNRNSMKRPEVVTRMLEARSKTIALRKIS